MNLSEFMEIELNLQNYLLNKVGLVHFAFCMFD